VLSGAGSGRGAIVLATLPLTAGVRAGRSGVRPGISSSCSCSCRCKASGCSWSSPSREGDQRPLGPRRRGTTAREHRGRTHRRPGHDPGWVQGSLTAENSRFSEVRPLAANTPSLSLRSDPLGSPSREPLLRTRPLNRELWLNRPLLDGRELGGDCRQPAPESPIGEDRGSASVTHRIEEMCRCPFTNDFATSSAMSAIDHPRGTLLQPRRPLLSDVPPMSRLARAELQ
jgi:hypothetical protein